MYWSGRWSLILKKVGRRFRVAGKPGLHFRFPTVKTQNKLHFKIIGGNGYLFNRVSRNKSQQSSQTINRKSLKKSRLQFVCVGDTRCNRKPAMLHCRFSDSQLIVWLTVENTTKLNNEGVSLSIHVTMNRCPWGVWWVLLVNNESPCWGEGYRTGPLEKSPLPLWKF